METDQDMYVSQLKEVFDSCDSSGQGLLTKDELSNLCSRLQMDDQSEILIQQLIGSDPNNKVSFDDFKEGFVSVLSENIEGMETTDDEEEEDQVEEEKVDGAEPKFVKGEKRYGRRSRPASESGDASNSDIDSMTPRRLHSELKLRLSSLEDLSNDELAEEEEDVFHDNNVPSKIQTAGHHDTETFEAEGQLNQSIAEMEAIVDPYSEQHLRDVWHQLGIGQDGSLSVSELDIVCKHIGMEEMSEEELQQLFDKLDVEGRGRVTFREFLNRLFSNVGSVTPSITPARPHSQTPRQKLKMSIANSVDDRQTPSFISSGSGIFTALDMEHSGYAKPDHIIELWENLGITQGADILDYLQFDLQTKLSLAELSTALEQELRSVEEDNATYQAAIVSYEYELKYLKTTTDQQSAERDKLKQDLTDAHSRIAFLVKEGDDRHANLEKSKEKELFALEKKYQEQLRSLQQETDREQEILVQQSAKQRRLLEVELETLRAEEGQLKERLSFSQQDIERLQSDLTEVTDRCGNLERQTDRQQRELEVFTDLQTKFEELESSKNSILDEQQRFSEEKIQHLKSENKGLKDQSDELTAEVEVLHQQISQQRRNRRANKERAEAQRSGSTLSDYTKVGRIGRKGSDGNSEESEDGSQTPTRRRQLPNTPSANASFEEEKTEQLEQDLKLLHEEKDQLLEQHESEQDKHREEVAKYQEEIARYKSELSKFEGQTQKKEDEVKEITRGFSIERKDIEDAFKMEIAELEEKHIKEKNELIKAFNKEKDDIEEEFDEQLDSQLKEQQQRLEAKAEQEKEDLIIKVESQKNLMKLNFQEEKEELNKQLKATEEGSSETGKLQQQVAALELQLKLQGEKMGLQHQIEMAALVEKLEEEKAVICDRHQQDIMDLENMCAEGPESLRGRLQTDFYALLDAHREKVSAEERVRAEETVAQERGAAVTSLQQQMEADHAALVNQTDQEKQRLRQELDRERAALRAEIETSTANIKEEMMKSQCDLEQTYQTKVKDLQYQLDAERLKVTELKLEHSKIMEEEQENQNQILTSRVKELEKSLAAEVCDGDRRQEDLSTALELERALWEQERHQMRGQLEEQLVGQLQEQMEDEFLQQLQQIKFAFEEERTEFESRISVLQQELEEVTQQQPDQVSITQKMEQETGKMRRQLDEANSTASSLRQQVDRLRADQESQQRALQQMMVEKQEAVSMATASRLQTGVPRSPTEDRDRVILQAIEDQKRHLDERTGDLKRSIVGLGTSGGSANPLQLSHDQLVEQNISLQKIVQDMEIEHRQIAAQTYNVEQSKARMENWETEKAALKDQLEMTSSQLAEANTALSLQSAAHAREVNQLNSQKVETVDATQYGEIHTKFVKAQSRIGELESALEERAAETTKLLMGTQNNHKRSVQQTKAELGELSRRLQVTDGLLTDQTAKLQQHYEGSSRTAYLVKDLYVENSNLIKCLELTERREKDANSKIYSLETKCRAYKRTIHAITAAAMG